MTSDSGKVNDNASTAAKVDASDQASFTEGASVQTNAACKCGHGIEQHTAPAVLGEMVLGESQLGQATRGACKQVDGCAQYDPITK